MTGRQRHAADDVGIAEGLFENDFPLMDDRDHAARLFGVAHLVVEPLRNVIERGLQPVVHVLHRCKVVAGSKSSTISRSRPRADAPPAAVRDRVAGARHRRSGSCAGCRCESRARADQLADRFCGFFALTEAGAGQREHAIGKGEIRVCLRSPCARAPPPPRTGRSAGKPGRAPTRHDKRAAPSGSGEAPSRHARWPCHRRRTRHLVSASKPRTTAAFGLIIVARSTAASAEFVIAGQGGAHRAGHGQRQRNIAARGDRRPGQALCRLAVVFLPARPIHQMALLPAPRGKRVGHRIAGIGLQRQAEQTQRLLIFFRGFGKGCAAWRDRSDHRRPGSPPACAGRARPRRRAAPGRPSRSGFR